MIHHSLYFGVMFPVSIYSDGRSQVQGQGRLRGAFGLASG